MKPIRSKYLSFAPAWCIALVVLGSDACSVRACEDWGCGNQTRLNGTVTIPEEVTTVQVRLVAGDTWEENSIDLQTSDDTELACSPILGTVCLKRTSDPGRFELSFSSDAGEGAAHDTTLRLVLTDPTSGQVLLDETRVAKSRITQNDDCHYCWTAEATL